MPQIEISIQESDSWGDGWNGVMVRVYDANSAQVAAHTLESGSSGSDVFDLEDNADYTWTFSEGSYIEEASFTMTRTDTGEVLGQAGGDTASGSFTLGAVASDGFLSTYASELGEFAVIAGQITLPANYTINVWVKNVTLPGQEWSNLYQQTSGAKYVLDANYGAIGTGTGPRLAVGASAPLQVADTWHLVSSVYDGSTMEYYVNGVSIGSVTPANPPSVIDVVNGPGGQNFAAVVKDLRLYDMVATSQQVLESYSTEGKFAEPEAEGEGGSPPPVDDGGSGDDSYEFSAVPTVNEVPSPDYDEAGYSPTSDGVFIHCSGGFDVYVKVDGTWDLHDSSFGTYSMLAADSGEGLLVYSNGSQAYAWARSSVMTDSSEDEDDLVDQFFMDAENIFDISSTEHTVSGEDSIEFPGETCQFVQVLESGRISYDYSVTISQESVTIAPPSGKDGQEIEIRLFL